MKVLIACEYSGIVRDAFISAGHDAISCDIIPTESPGPHIQDDVLNHLYDGWDLMIAHPPCTDLAVSGARWFKEKQADRRQQKSINFFMKLANAPINKIAIENPIGIMSKIWRKSDQIIQPWQFGESRNKSTCLWLKNLPLLIPTNIVEKERMVEYASGKRMPEFFAKTGGGSGKKRSEFFHGIAAAMAEQWGKE